MNANRKRRSSKAIKRALKEWLRNNLEDWSKYSHRQIARATCTSLNAVARYIPDLVAEMKGMSPAAARAERRRVAEEQLDKQRVGKEKVQRIHALWGNTSIENIAKEVGVSPAVVSKYLRKKKTVLARESAAEVGVAQTLSAIEENRTVEYLSGGDIKRIHELYECGCHVEVIAQEIGFPKETVTTCLEMES